MYSIDEDFVILHTVYVIVLKFIKMSVDYNLQLFIYVQTYTSNLNSCLHGIIN